MDRGAWQATIRGIARVGHDLVTKPTSLEMKYYGHFKALIYWKIHFHKVYVCVLSHVQLFVTPWTVSCQAPLSMEFPRQKD